MNEGVLLKQREFNKLTDCILIKRIATLRSENHQLILPFGYSTLKVKTVNILTSMKVMLVKM